MRMTSRKMRSPESLSPSSADAGEGCSRTTLHAELRGQVTTETASERFDEETHLGHSTRLANLEEKSPLLAIPGAAPVEVRPLIPLQVVGIAFAEFLASMRMLTATEQSTPPVKSHGPD